MNNKIKFSLNFNKFKTASNLNAKSFYAAIASKNYDEKIKQGFTDATLIGSVVSATFLEKINAYYSIWDENTGSMRKESYEMIKQVPFYIDFSKQILAVEGTTSNFNSIKKILRNLYYAEFTYYQISFTPLEIIQLFSEDKILIEIEQVTINDFKYENMFLGTYTAKMIRPDIDILMHFSPNITKIKSIIEIDGFKISFVISKNNSATIVCSADIKIALLEYLSNKF